jgi:hypothetical protein
MENIKTKIGTVKTITLYKSSDGTVKKDNYGNCRFYINLEDGMQLSMASKTETQNKYEIGKEYAFPYVESIFGDKTYYNIKLPQEEKKPFIPNKTSLTFEQQLNISRVQHSSIEAQVALKSAVEHAEYLFHRGDLDADVITIAKSFYKFLKECRDDYNTVTNQAAIS